MKERELATTIIAAMLAAQGKSRSADIEDAVQRYRACRDEVRAQWDVQAAGPPQTEERARDDAKIKEARKKAAKSVV
jgi:hypothetical protein